MPSSFPSSPSVIEPALILLSHGSRHPRAQAGIDELVAAVREALAGGIGGVSVEAAHLDFSEDTLTAVAVRLAAAGHSRAVVVPLLFSSGYHARVDVPAELEAAASASGLELVLGGTLGVGEDIAELLANRIPAATPETTGLVLYVVGSSRPEAQEDYERLRAALSRRTSRPVTLVQAAGPLAGELPVTPTGVHVLALFATDGLLLDKAREQLDEATSTLSAPLTSALSPVVAARYRQAVTP